MAVLNTPADGKKEGKAVPAAATASDEDKKKAKAEAAKRHAEKVAARNEAIFKGAVAHKDWLVKNKYWDGMDDASKTFILDLCKSPAERKAAAGGGSGQSTFAQIFGDSPKVGDKVTLETIFDKTLKGKSTIDVWVKRWAEKGIVVECIINPTKLKLTEYVIKALPSGN